MKISIRDLRKQLLQEAHKSNSRMIAEQNAMLPHVIVEDFLDAVIAASNLKTEENMSHWAKWINSVDLSHKNGWCFVGDFINDGTVEVPLGRSCLILAQSSITDETVKSGILRQFRVVLMDPQGNLSPTHIATDDRRGGWALRVRDLVNNFMKELDKPTQKENGNRFSNVEIQ